MTALLELRLNLANARANLRSAKDHYELTRAEAEQWAIDAGLAGGKNAEERARSLTLALAAHAQHRSALTDLRQAEAEVDRLEAQLEGTRDARRYDEWTIRARLADVLERTGIPSDSDDRAGDSAYDDVALWKIDGVLSR